MHHRPLRSTRPWEGALLGTVLFFTILACLWHLIVTSGPEIGDFGANSLLVQSAKHFQLLTGNYSRAGFNHPGPALLYVLAAGESLFYDGLHWVPSPLGAQLVTVAIYAAAWLTLLAALVRRLGLRPLEALAFLAAFAAFAASVEPEVFDGLWFPHLYFLPFAVFTLAVALLLRGSRQAWLPLALSYGFLFNGHVSFIPICCVMVLMALGADLVLGRLTPSDQVTWLSLPGFRRAAPHLVLPAAILVLFALPLLIATVTQFPGPIAKYVSFGRQHGRHGFIQGTVYLLQFWGRQPWQKAISLGSLVILAAGQGRSRFGWTLLLSAGIASAATLVYAVFGIDDYQYKYIAIFYGAVPALAVGGAVALLLSVLSGRRAAPWLAAASTAACFGLWASAIARPASYSGQYNVPDVVAISDAIDGLSSKPFVLDFSTATNWPQIQALMLGVDVYRQRLRGRLGYCIGQNWDLSLGTVVHCSEPEMAEEPHVLVDTSDTAVAQSFSPAESAAGLSFFKFDPPCLAAGDSLSLASDEPVFEHAILGTGWSAGGGDFVWSLGSSSRLHLCLADGVTALRLDLDAYRPVATSVQTAEVAIGGREVARLRFDGADPGGWRTIPLTGTPPGDLLLTLTVDHPISPHEANGAPDTRALGLALRSVAAQ